jgi:phosphatidylserine decarboxylase
MVTVIQSIVEKGRNLAAKDTSGTSDPYVIVNFLDQEAKSQIIKKTLNPEWKFQLVG